MSEFETLGRDVAASAEANADVEVASAVKALWVWAEFDQGENPNHSWEVEWWKNDDGFAVAARVKERGVYAPEPTPAPPASAEELRQATVADEPEVAVVTDEPLPETAVVAEEPEPAWPVTGPVDDAAPPQ